jgi:hypothetical protein
VEKIDAMRVLDSLAKLGDGGGDFRGVKGVLVVLFLQFGKGVAGDMIHGDGGPLFILDEVMDTDDARVDELAVALGLVLKLRHGAGVRGDGVRHEMKDDVLV